MKVEITKDDQQFLNTINSLCRKPPRLLYEEPINLDNHTRLGRGIGRICYRISDRRVVKVVDLSGGYADGYIQSINELILWSHATKYIKKFLVPIYGYAMVTSKREYICAFGTVCTYVDEILGGIKDHTRTDSISGKIFDIFNTPYDGWPFTIDDLHALNIGTIKGRPVVLDYGFAIPDPIHYFTIRKTR